MIAVPASGWFNTDISEIGRDTLKRSGIVPVNDVFYHLWENDNPVNILFGGYGSGKSVFIQTLFLHLSMQPNYFKGYYGRKVFEDVRGSVHSKFVTLIEDLGLQSEFKYSKEPNGSMVIVHKNGNKLIPFGAKNAEQLKSIDDPTHFFLEEMDQFSLEDFGTILSRLRTIKAKTQLYGAFNTGKVYSDHWIKKAFFGEDETFKEIKVNKLFCNYTDNYFIDQQDYYNKLALASNGDMELLRAMANGDWGSEKPTNPFFYTYSKDKHESMEAKFQPGKPIFISIDFNLNPFCFNFWHLWRDGQGEHAHCFDEMAIKNGSIPEMIDRIKAKYGQYLTSAMVTGDAMGKRGEMSQRDNSSLYTQIMRGLKMNSSQFKLPANPTHENSRADCNYVLYHLPDFKINPSTCPETCRDMKIVECDAFGSILKRDRGKREQQADFADTVRYLVNTFLKKWVVTHQKITK